MRGNLKKIMSAVVGIEESLPSECFSGALFETCPSSPTALLHRWGEWDSGRRDDLRSHSCFQNPCPKRQVFPLRIKKFLFSLTSAQILFKLWWWLRQRKMSVTHDTPIHLCSLRALSAARVQHGPHTVPESWGTLRGYPTDLGTDQGPVRLPPDLPWSTECVSNKKTISKKLALRTLATAYKIV